MSKYNWRYNEVIEEARKQGAKSKEVGSYEKLYTNDERLGIHVPRTNRPVHPDVRVTLFERLRRIGINLPLVIIAIIGVLMYLYGVGVL